MTAEPIATLIVGTDNLAGLLQRVQLDPTRETICHAWELAGLIRRDLQRLAEGLHTDAEATV